MVLLLASPILSDRISIDHIRSKQTSLIFSSPVSQNNEVIAYPTVGIATGCRLDGRGSIPGMGQYFSILHSVQTGSGARPSSYTIDTWGPFPGIKVAGV
jgi:hypothetical protein